MIKDINTLEYIFDLVKKTKKPIIKIYPDGKVIGTDLNFASMNMIIGNNISYNINIPYIFVTTELTAFMRTIQPNNISYSKFNIMSNGVILDNHIEMNNKFDDLYNRVISNYYKPLLYKEENFQLSVPEMFFLKASDGAKMYLFGIDKLFLMSSFNAIHPANKNDRVDLIIRDLDIYSYIAEFIIYKKKDNYQLHEFFRFRKL